MLPVALVLLLGLASCHSAAKRRRQFVEQFYAEDFRQFCDVHLLERGTDSAGNVVLLLFCPLADTMQHQLDLHAMLTANPNSGALLKLTYADSPAKYAQVPDSACLATLTRCFLRYRVASLGADAAGGVAVQFRSSAQFGPYDLVRVADTTSLSYEFREKYRQVRGPWYERRAAE